MDRVSPGAFDPERHNSHVIALFGGEGEAVAARLAVLQAGVAPDLVILMANGDALHRGDRHPIQDLFVPEDDYHDYHHALGRGHVIVVVRPASADMHKAALRALGESRPLDPATHGRRWRGTAGPVDRFAVNHATVSRADMEGRAIGGQDEVILDMTGQKMTVRRMSEDDMAAAPFAPPQDPADRPAPLAPPPPAREQPTSGTSYTYGVPAEIVRRMSPEDQVMAQPHTVEQRSDPTARGTYLRSVAGETRVGWRDTHGGVRSYVTERAADPRP